MFGLKDLVNFAPVSASEDKKIIIFALKFPSHAHEKFLFGSREFYKKWR